MVYVVLRRDGRWLDETPSAQGAYQARIKSRVISREWDSEVRASFRAMSEPLKTDDKDTDNSTPIKQNKPTKLRTMSTRHDHWLRSKRSMLAR